MSNPDVLGLVRLQLVAGGFDGLYLDGECGCLVDDLAPCGEVSSDCTAGYRIQGGPECAKGCENSEHFIVAEKKGLDR